MLCSACIVRRLGYSSGTKFGLVPTFRIIMSGGGIAMSLKALASRCRGRVAVRAATASGGANRGVVITKGSVGVISRIALSKLRANEGCGLSN